MIDINQWWGKLIGGLLGLAIKGPLGAVIGALLGHQFDKGLNRARQDEPAPDATVQKRFFESTFAVMGYVAKADGRVSENEILVARRYMHHFDLDETRKREAMRLFTLGKSPDFPLDATLNRLAAALDGRPRLLLQFVEIQIDAMLADSRAHPHTRKVLWRICQRLGINRVDMARLEAAAHARRTGFAQDGGVRAAYQVLGVEPDVDDKTLKTAYRRLMNRHHPDKLMAKGLPPEMMTQAREKTQAIQAAYETVKNSRGLP